MLRRRSSNFSHRNWESKARPASRTRPLLWPLLCSWVPFFSIWIPPAAADSVRLPFLGQVQQKAETENSSLKFHPTAGNHPYFSAACANEAHQIGEVAEPGGELVNARHGDARSALVEVGPAHTRLLWPSTAHRTARFCPSLREAS